MRDISYAVLLLVFAALLAWFINYEAVPRGINHHIKIFD